MGMLRQESKKQEDRGMSKRRRERERAEILAFFFLALLALSLMKSVGAC